MNTDTIQYYFYCFITGIGFMLLYYLHGATHISLLIEDFLPDHSWMLNVEYFLYNIGYFMVMVFGFLIIYAFFKEILNRSKSEN